MTSPFSAEQVQLMARYRKAQGVFNQRAEGWQLALQEMGEILKQSEPLNSTTMSYSYTGEKVRVPAEGVLCVLTAARRWLRLQLHQPRAGYVYVTLEKDEARRQMMVTNVSHSVELIDSKQVAPGMFAVPVVTLWAAVSADFQPLPLLVATGEIPEQGGAEIWAELWNSDAEVYPEPVIVGGDPAAMELDPDVPEEFAEFVRNSDERRWLNRLLAIKTSGKLDVDAFEAPSSDLREALLEYLRDFEAERPSPDRFRITWKADQRIWWIEVAAVKFVAPVIDPASACVVAPCAELLEVSGEFGPRKMAEAEGRACAEELLRVGSPEDVRKRAIAPCPYPLGSAARVWWCWGLNQVVKAAEEAALGDALVNQFKNS